MVEHLIRPVGKGPNDCQVKNEQSQKNQGREGRDRFKGSNVYQKSRQIQPIYINGKKQNCHNGLMEHRVVELMVDAQVLALRDSFFDPLKLEAGKISKQKDQTEKQCERIKRRKKSVIGGLIGKINT